MNLEPHVAHHYPIPIFPKREKNPPKLDCNLMPQLLSYEQDPADGYELPCFALSVPESIISAKPGPPGPHMSSLKNGKP